VERIRDEVDPAAVFMDPVCREIAVAILRGKAGSSGHHFVLDALETPSARSMVSEIMARSPSSDEGAGHVDKVESDLRRRVRSRHLQLRMEENRERIRTEQSSGTDPEILRALLEENQRLARELDTLRAGEDALSRRSTPH
jgi:hypothetical protein